MAVVRREYFNFTKGTKAVFWLVVIGPCLDCGRFVEVWVGGWLESSAFMCECGRPLDIPEFPFPVWLLEGEDQWSS